MNNNDILSRIRHTFDLNNSEMISVFELANQEVTEYQVIGWSKDEDDPEYQDCKDVELATFLNGFINKRRGKKDGDQPEAEKRLTNNIIFKKLKIALDMKDEDVFSVMSLAGYNIKKPELSAISRKKGHKNYRTCKDEVLDKFLMGIQLNNAK